MMKPKRTLLCLSERIKIKELLDQGYNILKICKFINRNCHTISREIGGHEGARTYDPQLGQKKSDERELKRGEAISRANIGKRRKTDPMGEDLFSQSKKDSEIQLLEQRISCLEMQIEIIIEQLRKLNDKLTKNQ